MLYNFVLGFSNFLIVNVLSVFSFNVTSNFDFWLLLPEILFVLFLFYHLITFSDNKKNPAKDFYKLLEILFVILVLFIYLLVFFRESTTTSYNHVYLITDYILVSKAFVILLTLSVLWIAKHKITIPGTFFYNCITEFSIIIIFSLLFIFIILSSADFLCLFLAVEGLSATSYVLCAMMCQSITASESALKYFSLGAVASGILLYGIVCLYGITNSLEFNQVQYYLSSNVVTGENNILIQLSFVCILWGFLFKIGSFPGHTWIVDVYDGIWKPVVAFFSIVVKVGFVLFLLRLVFDVLYPIRHLIQPILGFSGIASMFVGTAGALQQNKIIRFISYASINQIGYLLLGMASCSFLGLASCLLFIVTYAITSLVFFRIILNIGRNSNGSSIVYLSQLINFSSQNSVSGICLSIIILSMGGLPPLGGFVGKYLIYESMYQAHLEFLLIFSLLISVVTVSYYLDFVKLIWFRVDNIKCDFSYRKDWVFSIVLVGFLVSFIFIFPNVWSVILDLAVSCLNKPLV